VRQERASHSTQADYGDIITHTNPSADSGDNPDFSVDSSVPIREIRGSINFARYSISEAQTVPV
jgi:hypothetical protein